MRWAYAGMHPCLSEHVCSCECTFVRVRAAACAIDRQSNRAAGPVRRFLSQWKPSESLRIGQRGITNERMLSGFSATYPSAGGPDCPVACEESFAHFASIIFDIVSQSTRRPHA